jgi:hypothetical protein
MTERDIQNEIQKELSRAETRLLRINSGSAWGGTIVERTAHRLVLSPYRPIKLAAEGVSDLIGWTTSPRDLIAHFVAIEVKGPRTRTTPEQIAFIDLVRRAGGRAGIARSVEEAELIIAGK